MARIERTVFISYRRTNLPWALAIFQYLTQHGYDVFIDFSGIASGEFETVILDNIHARAHFLVLLTPSALERCGDPGDWLRREIEFALENKRNIVPLMLEGFDFGTPTIANQLTGKLAALKLYNALSIPPAFFFEAMGRLRDRYLNVTLDAVLQPASPIARQAANDEKGAAAQAPEVAEKELTAQQWFERGFNTRDLDERVRFYGEAIRLQPDYAAAFNNRGHARADKGDADGALADFDQAIQLGPDHVQALYNRGLARYKKADFLGALADYNQAIRYQPDDPANFNNRANVFLCIGDLQSAIADCNEAIRLSPDFYLAFDTRGDVRRAQGDLEGALQDYDQAIRLKPDYATAYSNREIVLSAIADRSNP